MSSRLCVGSRDQFFSSTEELDNVQESFSRWGLGSAPARRSRALLLSGVALAQAKPDAGKKEGPRPTLRNHRAKNRLTSREPVRPRRRSRAHHARIKPPHGKTRRVRAATSPLKAAIRPVHEARIARRRRGSRSRVKLQVQHATANVTRRAIRRVRIATRSAPPIAREAMPRAINATPTAAPSRTAILSGTRTRSGTAAVIRRSAATSRSRLLRIWDFHSPRSRTRA